VPYTQEDTVSRRRLLLANLAAVLVLAAGAAGCGGDDDDDDDAEASEAPPATDTAGAGAEGDAAAGKTVFTDNCGSCHTLADAGTSGNTGPNLDDLQPSFETVQQQVVSGGGAMPAFGDDGLLTDQQIADVSAYVSSVAGSR
jgi:mono/diheme cytochrome c family protein